MRFMEINRLIDKLKTGANKIKRRKVKYTCPGCQQIFKEELKEHDSNIKVYDITELMEKAL